MGSKKKIVSIFVLFILITILINCIYSSTKEYFSKKSQKNRCLNRSVELVPLNDIIAKEEVNFKKITLTENNESGGEIQPNISTQKISSNELKVKETASPIDETFISNKRTISDNDALTSESSSIDSDEKKNIRKKLQKKRKGPNWEKKIEKMKRLMELNKGLCGQI